MVAFAGSFLLSFVLIGVGIAFGKRRPVGAPLTWGEAMAAATFVFFVMFWAYGVVPHQWLQFSSNEWQWTPTKRLLGPGKVLETYVPFTLNYEAVRDIVAVGIYGLYLGIHVAVWAIWNDRSKSADKKAQRQLAPSTYGRPLVKQG